MYHSLFSPSPHPPSYLNINYSDVCIPPRARTHAPFADGAKCIKCTTLTHERSPRHTGRARAQRVFIGVMVGRPAPLERLRRVAVLVWLVWLVCGWHSHKHLHEQNKHKTRARRALELASSLLLVFGRSSTRDGLLVFCGVGASAVAE